MATREQPRTSGFPTAAAPLSAAREFASRHALLLIVALAAVARFATLDTPTYWFDESLTVIETRKTVAEMWDAIREVLIWDSQEVRTYPLLVFLSALSFMFFVYSLRSVAGPARTGRSARRQAGRGHLRHGASPAVDEAGEELRHRPLRLGGGLRRNGPRRARAAVQAPAAVQARRPGLDASPAVQDLPCPAAGSVRAPPRPQGSALSSSKSPGRVA